MKASSGGGVWGDEVRESRGVCSLAREEGLLWEDNCTISLFEYYEHILNTMFWYLSFF